ncbi:recombinase family protein [Verrucomicrobiaceae bacterium R5-34]|nr:recombinase family protein [Verrucomicrobiaceae bacterium R5-34]
MAKTNKTTKAAILVRVSTNKQDTQRQIRELEDIAESKGWQIVEIIKEEGISGDASDTSRHGLARATELAVSGGIDKIMVHEVSRLARKNSTAHKFIEGLEQAGVSLYWHAQGIETLLPNGKRNPAASVMFALLAEMARNELETLRARINSGLEEARRRGKTLGRPKGSTLSTEALLTKHKDIVKRLKTGQSIRDTAKLTGKGISTVQRVKAALEKPA